MPTLEWKRLTIVGCGLMGASFALALKRSGAQMRIAGWDCSETVLKAALDRGVIDEVDRSFANGTVSAADLIYLAMPVGGIVEFLRTHGSQTKKGALITDTGSTKAAVCRAAREYLPEGRHFVGGHPITGSQHAGLAQARADLFAHTTYALIDASEAAAGLFELTQVLEAFGAHVVFMTAAEHDATLALISHLPQLLSTALAATVKSQSHANALLKLAGPGYRDMTRLAASPWPMWRDILATNPAPITDALSAMVRSLTILEAELQKCSGQKEVSLTAAERMFRQAQAPPESNPGSTLR
jgi:prephenate dehydrogenase